MWRLSATPAADCAVYEGLVAWFVSADLSPETRQEALPLIWHNAPKFLARQPGENTYDQRLGATAYACDEMYVCPWATCAWTPLSNYKRVTLLHKFIDSGVSSRPSTTFSAWPSRHTTLCTIVCAEFRNRPGTLGTKASQARW